MVKKYHNATIKRLELRYYCPKKQGGCGTQGAVKQLNDGTFQAGVRRTHTLQCASCGEKFRTANPYQQQTMKCNHCTKTGPDHTPIVIKPCEWCETLFVYRKTRNRQRRFCTKRCMDLKARKDMQERRKNGDQPQHSFQITRDKRLQIAYRYGYKCHLCHKLIDVSRRAPHPLALSIDHLIPQAEGGSHNLDNLAPAHFKCNSERAHRGAAQLQAFGAERT
jgi:hypothetical protein